MKKALSTLLFTAIIALTASAQFGFGGAPMVFSKAKIKSGDANIVKGKTIKVEFIYDGMRVGKYKTEAEYIAKKKKGYDEKEPGRGDKWEAAWKGDRKTRFEPSFFQKFNELGKETKTTAVADGAADYTLVITTLYTDPGYNIGVSRAPAIVNALCEFKDASGKSVLVVSVDKIPGTVYGGFDFDTGTRLSECYEKLGKDLYRTIAKKFSK
jgi:hypothetical protein